MSKNNINNKLGKVHAADLPTDKVSFFDAFGQKLFDDRAEGELSLRDYPSHVQNLVRSACVSFDHEGSQLALESAFERVASSFVQEANTLSEAECNSTRYILEFKLIPDFEIRSASKK